MIVDFHEVEVVNFSHLNLNSKRVEVGPVHIHLNHPTTKIVEIRNPKFINFRSYYFNLRFEFKIINFTVK